MKSSPEALPSADLEEAIRTALATNPEGLTEFALFAALAGAGFACFEREVFADRMRMFRSHFVLFHVLYAMRERLVMRGEGHLTIDALCIKLEPFGTPATCAAPDLAPHDPLRDYYLDLRNLTDMTDDGLADLLGRFWERFRALDRRGEALAVLGLEGSSDWESIRSRHRSLVFEHHPDRGGDGARLAEINAAMRVLDAIRSTAR